MKTKRLVLDALCAALYTLLSSYVSISLLHMKLSFAALPLVLGAMLFGPADGLVIGLLGSFLSQLLGAYGLSVTTPLWMLPPIVHGLLIGLWARRRGFECEARRPLATALVLTALVVTALNTGAMWVDSRVFAYPFAATLPSVALRIAAALITSGLYTLILPPILRALRRGGLTERTDA